MPELWQPIKGYEGLYEVSDQGRVRSLERALTKLKKNGTRYTCVLKAKSRKLVLCKEGYLTVMLSQSSKVKLYAVHCLVADAFIAKRLDGYDVNHKDLNKVNNCVSNLEYVTRSENLLHAARAGLMSRPNNQIIRDSKGRIITVVKKEPEQSHHCGG